MCTPDGRRRSARHQSGLTFVELIMFIVIVSVAVTGVLMVISFTSSRSADPMVRKQALAIAESLLEEIELQPFTYCDPTDANVTTATSATLGSSSTTCATTVESLGPEPGESRYSVTTPFNNVNDYGGTTSGATNNLMPSGILDVTTGAAIAGLENYTASVTITQDSLGGVAATESLRIDVRVTGPGGTEITLTGYRLRYAPTSV